METKLTTKKLYNSKIKQVFDGMLSVDAYNRRSGIAICWKSHVQLTIQFYSMNHIREVVNDPNLNVTWYLISFYGNPVKKQKWRSWKLLEHLIDNCNPVVLVVEDFNEIISPLEKLRGQI